MAKRRAKPKAWVLNNIVDEGDHPWVPHIYTKAKHIMPINNPSPSTRAGEKVLHVVS